MKKLSLQKERRELFSLWKERKENYKNILVAKERENYKNILLAKEKEAKILSLKKRGGAAKVLSWIDRRKELQIFSLTVYRFKMIFHYNRVSVRDRRRELRQNSTPAEIKLWGYLRNRNLLGVKFRRQYSIDNYIIDFYSPEYKLAIEVDGDIHLVKEVKENDEIRQQYIEKFGIRFLRVTNDMVLNDINEVLRQIEKEIKRK